MIYSREERICSAWENYKLLILKPWDRHNMNKRNKVKNIIIIKITILVTLGIKRELYKLGERQCEENI